jgi:hypothetical protein
MLIRFCQLNEFVCDLQSESEAEAIFLVLQAGKFKGRYFPPSNIVNAKR